MFLKNNKILMILSLTVILGVPAKTYAKVCYPLVFDAGMIKLAVLMSSYDGAAKGIIANRNNSYTKAANAISASEREIQAALKAGTQSNVNSIAVTLRQHALANQVDKNGKTFSANSKSVFACPTELPTGLLQGAADKRAMTDAIYKGMTERNQRGELINKNIKDMKATWTNTNASKVVKGENVLPTKETLSEDQLVAGSYLTNFITNALPSEKLNDRLAATSFGQQYAMIDNIKNVRIAPAQKSFSLILGNSAPVYEMGDWLEDMKSRSGNLTVSSEGGKISANGILAARIDARYLDLKWIQEHPKDKTGTLREIVLVKSISLEVLRRRLEIAQHLRVVLATTLANQIDLNMGADLESSYDVMIEKTL